MSFNDVLKNYDWDDVQKFINSRTERDVEISLGKDRKDDSDHATLLSKAAEKYIEPMAAEAHKITVQRFGKTIKIYAPIYLSNVCSNSCVYCGFNAKNQIPRLTLTEDEIRAELEIISRTGIQHLLLVTGESPKLISLDYLKKSAELARERFSSVSIEIYPLDTDGYSQLYKAGVDGLTIYQETYNRETYANVHPAGKKRDYDWRLETPERGAEAGMRTVGLGTLMGLQDFRTEQFFTALHAKYMMKKYWKTHITMSFPRIREASGGYLPENVISDTNLVQSMVAHRLCMNDAGLIISTREPAHIRDHLIFLGVTQMSAGSKTEPGGYGTNPNEGKQFEIEDARTSEEFCNMVRSKGYDPVLKDWDKEFIETV